MSIPAFVVTMRLGGTVRRVSSDSEREAALAAESIVRMHPDDAASMRHDIVAADPAAGLRVGAYLADVGIEMGAASTLADR